MGAAALARLAVWEGNAVTPRSPERVEMANTTASVDRPAAAPLGVAVAEQVEEGALGHINDAEVGRARAKLCATAASPGRGSLRRGVTLPTFGMMTSKTSRDASSDRALDESYRELLKNRIASTSKVPVPAIEASELDTVENLFHGADTNADGVVDFDEFKGVMEMLAKSTGKRYNTLQLRGLFRMADLDGSGSIDFNEFIHAQRRMKRNWGTAKAATMMMAAMQSAKAKQC